MEESSYSFIEATTTMMEESTYSFIEVTTSMEESLLKLLPLWKKVCTYKYI